ncbi:MAG: hypothetical protein KY457_01015 [Actinobacteria bacterium]|nr:hypothetical protein [Actinomycetota bacterium]
MSVGPLRRSIGALGLLALVPVAAMLVVGTLDPVDAAKRSLVTLIGLLVLGRLASWGVHAIASTVERGGTEPEGAGEAETAASPTATVNTAEAAQR